MVIQLFVGDKTLGTYAICILDAFAFVKRMHFFDRLKSVIVFLVVFFLISTAAHDKFFAFFGGDHVFGECGITYADRNGVC